MGKIIRKLISLLFGLYACATSFCGALYILETERGITEPSTVVLFVIGTFSLLIFCFAALGAQDFLGNINKNSNEKKR